MKAKRHYLFIGTGLVAALTCGLAPLPAVAAPMPASLAPVAASDANAVSNITFTQTVTPKLEPGASGDATIRYSNGAATATGVGAKFQIDAPAGTTFYTNWFRLKQDTYLVGWSLQGTLSADKRTLTIDLPNHSLGVSGWAELNVGLASGNDNKRSGVVADGKMTVVSGAVIPAGTSTSLAYDAQHEAVSLSQTVAPTLEAGKSGDTTIRFTNNTQTATKVGTKFELTAPTGTTFMSTTYKLTSNTYPSGWTLNGALSADKRTLTIDLPQYSIAANGWAEMVVALASDADNTRSGVVADGKVTVTGGAALPTGLTSKLSYTADHVGFSLSQTVTPKLQAGGKGDATIRYTNNTQAQTGKGAAFELAAPAGTTFDSAAFKLKQDTYPSGWALNGVLSADKRTLTIDLPNHSIGANGWAEMVVTLASDADNTRSGAVADGKFTSTGGVVVPAGTTTPLTYQAEYVAPDAVVLDAPAIGAVVTGSNRPVFSGTGEPGAEITVRGSSGRVVATTTVKADGTWSAPASFDLVNGNYFGTVTQGVDGSSARYEFVLNHNAPKVEVAPVTFTSPVKNEQILAGKPVFTGKGQPDATISLMGRYGTPIGSGVVMADGTWQIESMVSLVEGSYAVIATQKVDGNTSTAEVEFRTAEPGFVTLTGPAIDAELGAGNPVFTGTGTPGAKVMVQGRFGTILGETTVGDNGEWSVESTVSLVPASYAGFAKQEVNGKITSAPFQFTVK